MTKYDEEQSEEVKLSPVEDDSATNALIPTATGSIHQLELYTRYSTLFFHADKHAYS
jgi:hypothetical protein